MQSFGRMGNILVMSDYRTTFLLNRQMRQVFVSQILIEMRSQLYVIIHELHKTRCSLKVIMRDIALVTRLALVDFAALLLIVA